MVRKSKYFNYARPSFLEGMARIFDFGGSLDYYPRRSAVRKSGPEADAEALREHWEAVGQYIRDAIGQFEAEEQDNLNAARKSECQNRTN